MRIAILNDSFPPQSEGGAAVIAWNQAMGLKKAGHEVLVVTTSEDRDSEGVRTESGVTIQTFYSKYALRWRAYKSLNNRKLVKKVGSTLANFRPDIVHAHNVHLHLSYAVLAEAKKYAQAVFLTVHDSMPFHYSKLFPETVGSLDGNIKSYKVSAWRQFRLFKSGYNPFRNRIIKKYLEIPTKIFAVSGALAQALTDNGIQNVEVLHNGIDVAAWQAKPAVINEKDFIFFGGRLSAVKGGGVLVDALREVLKTHANARLLVVGEKNEFAEAMEREAATMEVENLIFFTGKRPYSEMKDMYEGAVMVAVPSLCFDWFPTIILEAMASKKPVIATCFGGAKELVVDGKTGFIVNPVYPKELTDKILLLLNNRNLVEEMGNAGYERVKNEFSLEKHLGKLLAWYDKVLKI